MQYFNNGNSEMKIDKDGILHVRFNFSSLIVDDDITDRNVIDFIYLIEKLCNGNSLPILINLTEVFGTLSKKNQMLIFTAPELKKIRLAQAFVVDSLSMTLFVRFHLINHQYNCPSKIFKEEEEAVNWLMRPRTDFVT